MLENGPTENGDVPFIVVLPVPLIDLVSLSLPFVTAPEVVLYVALKHARCARR